MLHKQEADELGAHLKKIVDTERKADQIGRRLTVKRGVYLWGLRACWWVPFIRFALMQIIDGDLPTPITIHMLFYIGSSARWQPPPERWRRVLYLYAGVTIWARHLGGIGPGPRARAQPGRVPTLGAPGRPRGPFAFRPRDPLDRPGQKWGAIFSQCLLWRTESASVAIRLRLSKQKSCRLWCGHHGLGAASAKVGQRPPVSLP